MRCAATALTSIKCYNSVKNESKEGRRAKTEEVSNQTHSPNFKYITETVSFKVQRPITQTVIKPTKCFLCSICHLMLLDIFCKASRKSLKHTFSSYTKDTRTWLGSLFKCPKGGNSKNRWFRYCSCVLHIISSFSFKKISQTDFKLQSEHICYRNHYLKCLIGQNSKCRLSRSTVCVLCHNVLRLCEVKVKYLKRFPTNIFDTTW